MDKRRGILRKIRKVAGMGIAGIEDIVPENFLGDELPDPKKPFTFWCQSQALYYHVGCERCKEDL